MIAQNFEYATPSSLKEALALLADPSAKALAGGMSLIPLMKLRLAAPEKVVDLRKVPGLNSVKQENNTLLIGSMVTHFEVESTPLIRTACPLLAETASNIGDVQVRNMGTLGGSVAHADPAADYPAALRALEAKIRIAGPKGERTLSADEFFVDTFTTALEQGELIVEIRVPVEMMGIGVSYQKCLQPASGFAIVGVAARVMKANGKATMARVGMTGVAGNSYRALKVEKLLEEGASIATAAAAATDGIEANSDIHASAEYRLHLARIYTERALQTAFDRAK